LIISGNTPVSPLRVRARCLEYAARPEPREFDNRKLGAVIGQLEAAVKQLSQAGNDVTDFNRRLVQGFLFLAEDRPFEPISAKGLTAQEKHALEMWVGSVHDAETDAWLPRVTFKAEAVWILGVAQFFLCIMAANDSAHPVHYHTLLDMYKTEIGINENAAAGPDYWLAAAMEMPGAVLTRVYENGGGESE
jgi:hypothetical protein